MTVEERRASPESSGAQRLSAYFRRRGRPGTETAPLVQDAGERMYFRAAFPGRGPVVVCLMSAPYAPGALPFSDSTGLYRSLGIAVPRILDEAPDLGVVLLEDLGDDLLQHRVLRREPDAGGRYFEAVDLLGRIQRRGRRLERSPDAGRFRAFRMRLDAPLFLRELRFFGEHFLGLGSRIPQRLDRLFAELAEEAAGAPLALCHRDFHSRNLVVPADGGLVVIDHQDTRIGPRGYDVMSLLRDPYVRTGASPIPFEEAVVLDRFREGAGLASAGEELLAEMDTVALQRLLKALGTYGFQVRARGNAVYAQYVEPTVAMVRETLDRAPRRSSRAELGALLGDLALR